MTSSRKRNRASASSYLEGQLLLAMPTMPDKRFQRTVIYLCKHSEEGAMGLIVNKRANHLTFPDLLRQLKVVDDAAEEAMSPDLLNKSVHVGGPVSTERGFVLHSGDYFADDATLAFAGGICLTATIDILKAMAIGSGPEQAILALGFSSWAPGQLEGEIHANTWLHCAADNDLLFSSDVDLKYDRALFKLGVDPSHFVTTAGHA